MCSENLSEALEKLKLASADGAAASADGCLDSLLKALGNNSEYGQNLHEHHGSPQRRERLAQAAVH